MTPTEYNRGYWAGIDATTPKRQADADRIAQLERALASALRVCDEKAALAQRLGAQLDHAEDAYEDAAEKLAEAREYVREADATNVKLWTRIDEARKALQ